MTRLATELYVTTETGLLVPKSIVDAKGDLLIGASPNTVARLPVGADGQVLTAKASATNGVDWETPVSQTILADVDFTQGIPASWTGGSPASWTYDSFGAVPVAGSSGEVYLWRPDIGYRNVDVDVAMRHFNGSGSYISGFLGYDVNDKIYPTWGSDGALNFYSHHGGTFASLGSGTNTQVASDVVYWHRFSVIGRDLVWSVFASDPEAHANLASDPVSVFTYDLSSSAAGKMILSKGFYVGFMMTGDLTHQRIQRVRILNASRTD